MNHIAQWNDGADKYKSGQKEYLEIARKVSEADSTADKVLTFMIAGGSALFSLLSLVGFLGSHPDMVFGKAILGTFLGLSALSGIIGLAMYRFGGCYQAQKEIAADTDCKLYDQLLEQGRQRQLKNNKAALEKNTKEHEELEKTKTRLESSIEQMVKA